MHALRRVQAGGKGGGLGGRLPAMIRLTALSALADALVISACADFAEEVVLSSTSAVLAGIPAPRNCAQGRGDSTGCGTWSAGAVTRRVQLHRLHGMEAGAERWEGWFATAYVSKGLDTACAVMPKLLGARSVERRGSINWTARPLEFTHCTRDSYCKRLPRHHLWRRDHRGTSGRNSNMG